ncbi:MAG: DUF763 domain-containing protein [Candidatus Bathyarchaeota archaeon]|nr:DUF763 domain-containing protein [Candidatus Bathyarchaeota archaeon]
MHRAGVASLPLHYGKAPRWLVTRMCKLAREMTTIITQEYGAEAFLSRISDPFWFQALGCVLGYDWHSSGVTTVLTGVLKQAVTPEEHGIAVCGGKGNASRQTPKEILKIGDKFSFSTQEITRLQYASKMSAKVDNTAIQAGYPLYHHSFFVTEKKKWAVVQQGMCLQDRTARRYHWISDNVQSFVVEPQNAIIGETRRQTALDMTAKESEACRKTSVGIAKEPPNRTMSLIAAVEPSVQRTLQDWLPESSKRTLSARTLVMPRKTNWKVLRQIYEFQPRNYEELLAIRGVGPATIRGLALVAELIYGDRPSWKDPVKYSFAYGGKDGVPYPVDRESMDKSIQMLKLAVQEAKVGNNEKMRSLRRLRQFVPAEISG